MRLFEGFILAILIFMGGCWIGNAVKLTNCDFEAPYKGEVLHTIGLIPLASVFTVWVDDK